MASAGRPPHRCAPKTNRTQGVERANYTHFYTLWSAIHITCIKFSHNGKWLAAGHLNGTIKIFDPHNGKQLYILNGHTECINDLEFSKDHFLLASASCDKSVRMWGFPKGKLYKKYQERHPKIYTACSLSLKADLLVAASHGRFVLYDVKTCTMIRKYNSNTRMTEVTSITFLHNITALGVFFSSMTGRSLLVDLGMKYIDTEYSAAFPVTSSKFSRDDEFCLESVQQSQLLLSEFDDSNLPIRVYEGHTCRFLKITATFSETGSRLLVVSGSEDNCVYIWDLETSELLQKLEGHEEPVIQVECHPIINMIASRSNDKTIKIWKSEF